MLSDIDIEDVSAPVTLPDPKRPTPEEKRFIVPAQDWEEWSSLCCAQKLAEANSGEVISVPAMEHGGYLHAVFSVLYGGRSGEYKAYAWQLVPAVLYPGESWTHVSGCDFDDSVRERGDYTGMRVSVRGAELICAKPVNFIRTLPTSPPVSTQDAKRYDEMSRGYGWRSMRFNGAKVSWKLLQGHPVVVYEATNGGGHMAVLLWKHKGIIQDYYLGNQIDASTLPDLPQATEAPVEQDLISLSQSSPAQAVLF